jgi:hypothetical protein
MTAVAPTTNALRRRCGAVGMTAAALPTFALFSDDSQKCPAVGILGGNETPKGRECRTAGCLFREGTVTSPKPDAAGRLAVTTPTISGVRK